MRGRGGPRVLVRSAAGWPITRGVWDAGSCLQRGERGCACPAPRRWLPPRSVGQGHFPDSWDSPWTGCPSSQSAAGACPKVAIWVPPTPDTARVSPRSPAGSGAAGRPGQHWLRALLLPHGPRWNGACCIPLGPAPRVPPWSQCPERESPSSQVTPLRCEPCRHRGRS